MKRDLEEETLMGSSRIGTLVVVLALSFAVSAAAQRGVGQWVGVAQRAEKPAIETISGTLKEVKIGRCERTTGRSLLGVHMIVAVEEKSIDLHLGPAAALEDVVVQLSADQPITFEAFRTDVMPEDAYVAKSLTVSETTFDLRDDNLRPYWAIGPRGDRRDGRGMEAGRGWGRSQGWRARAGGGGCWW
jgi:hypothetical protein